MMKVGNICAVFLATLLLNGLAMGQSLDVNSIAATEITATILGSETEVCQGDSVAAYLNFTGRSPWDVKINDKDGLYLELKKVETPYTIWLKPVENNRYYIASVKDRTGKSGKTYGEVSISVFPSTPVTFQIEKTTFLQTDPPVTLASAPPGAAFSGNGVIGNQFYPRIATAIESPHLLTCTFTNSIGCKSSDEVQAHVLYGEGAVYLVSEGDTINALCDDGKTYEIRGSNLDQIAGSFELRAAGSQEPVPGHISDKNPGDDKAILDPAGLAGPYDIIYTYKFQTVTVTKTSRFTVNDPGIIEIPGLPEQVCKSDDPYPLVPNLAENDPGAVFEFSGPGVHGNQVDGFFYDPGDPEAPAGPNEILLVYTGTNGCSHRLTRQVNNRFVPAVQFTISSACLPRDGGLVTFENLTDNKSTVEGWLWDFGDPASGIKNYSPLENPGHFYAEPGPRQITLNATIRGGCVGSRTVDTILSQRPVADLTWINDCFVKGQKVEFVNRTTSLYTSLDTMVWTIRNLTGGVLKETGTNSPSDTVDYLFEVQGNYLVDLYVRDENGCEGDTTRELLLMPVTPVDATGYKEDFDGTKSNWFSGSGGGSNSWIRGVPDFHGFDQVAGDLAWFTDLPPEQPGLTEHSWIRSGCFDFSNMRSPVFQMELMKSFTPDRDGAVLQYQDVVSEGWKTIGNVGDGNNWYNATGLSLEPGGSDQGWGGSDPFQADSQWITAVHDLDLVAGLSHVKFRIAIATGGTGSIGNQGFAFDDVIIRERIRRSLLEYFTNSSSLESRDADEVVDQFALSHPGTMIDLQYHVDYPGVDPMNENNPYPPSTRYFSYGVQGIPFALLNGGTAAGETFDFSGPAGEPNDNVLKQASLEIPMFDVDLAVMWGDERLEASTMVTCRTQEFSSNLQLYLVVIERVVTALPGLNLDTSFRNVVLEMLPSPAGKLLGNSWYDGKTDSRTYSWDYAEYVEDIDELAVVAFVQDRDHGRVLQASMVPHTPGVGMPARRSDPGSLWVFPNPAREHIYVNFGAESGAEGELRIVDLAGRSVMQSKVLPGATLQRLEISHLSRGLYMIYWVEQGVEKGRSKLVFGL